jgi:purine-binding chemotaxis protein CheW
MNKSGFLEKIQSHLRNAHRIIEHSQATAIDPQSLLKERAKELSLSIDEGKQESLLQVIEFVLAEETYFLETRFVREVYPLRDLTSIPCTPDFVLGIINVRGQVLSVIDLKRFFNLPDIGISDLNKAVIIRDGTMELGILADVIGGYRSIPQSQLQKSFPSIPGIDETYLKSITVDGKILLDAKAILSDKRIVIHEEVEL